MSDYAETVIDPGDAISRFARELNEKSLGNCPAVTALPLGGGSDFRGPVGGRYAEHILRGMLEGDILFTAENDGAGGKTQFVTLVGAPLEFAGSGAEVPAMVFEDICRNGGLPLVALNQIDFKGVTPQNIHLAKAALTGYHDALQICRVANFTGETAIMRFSITAFCDTNDPEQLIFTWSGSCLGISSNQLFISGEKVGPGLTLIGVHEPGYRCNGGTFFIKLLQHFYGTDIRAIQANPEAMKFVRELCVPSQLLSPAMSHLSGWNPDGSIRPLRERFGIRGFYHITGGGLKGKFAEKLPDGIGAVLDTMPEPAPVLRKAQEMSWDGPHHLSDSEAYTTLHGGCSLVIAIEPEYVEPVLFSLNTRFGLKASVVGRTISSPAKEVQVLSRFKKGGWFSISG